MTRFDIDGFMEYMRTEFPEPMQYHFTYDLLKNLIGVLVEQFESSVQIANILHRIVPEITVEEVLFYMN